MNETKYLLKDKKNRKRLLQAIKSINKRKNLIEVTLKEIEDIDNVDN